MTAPSSLVLLCKLWELFLTVDLDQLYKDYYQKKFCHVYEEAKDGHLSNQHASEQYGVPKSKFADKISGWVKFGAHSNPPHYLSDSEEKEFH